ncbi:hypothetical protein [Leekyejoonella antrihumi]|uniref:Uncharacterized protein n=1 Tax=Leekyejoonella antrihumi TaxID=1660198 RepID=A0A563E8V4_9MICO|nr:hypothetical protein [Leekyejoonella antrihumi]TWP38244.1 hypothetical protein FGL98_03220 [Leekyejoonella antrihumi]
MTRLPLVGAPLWRQTAQVVDRAAVRHCDQTRSVQTLPIGPCGLLSDIVTVFETLWSFATPLPDRTHPSPPYGSYCASKAAST